MNELPCKYVPENAEEILASLKNKIDSLEKEINLHKKELKKRSKQYAKEIEKRRLQRIKDYEKKLHETLF